MAGVERFLRAREEASGRGELLRKLRLARDEALTKWKNLNDVCLALSDSKSKCDTRPSECEWWPSDYPNCKPTPWYWQAYKTADREYESNL